VSCAGWTATVTACTATLAVAAQRLQTIAGRHKQIVELLRRVDPKQLRSSASLSLRRQIADAVSSKDLMQLLP
jgi:hypothetical protein